MSKRVALRYEGRGRGCEHEQSHIRLCEDRKTIHLLHDRKYSVVTSPANAVIGRDPFIHSQGLSLESLTSYRPSLPIVAPSRIVPHVNPLLGVSDIIVFARLQTGPHYYSEFLFQQQDYNV